MAIWNSCDTNSLREIFVEKFFWEILKFDSESKTTEPFGTTNEIPCRKLNKKILLSLFKVILGQKFNLMAPETIRQRRHYLTSVAWASNQLLEILTFE